MVVPASWAPARYQHRNPLKPDEIKAYSSNLVQAFAHLEAARAAPKKAMERMK
jgi:hypothetical protein